MGPFLDLLVTSWPFDWAWKYAAVGLPVLLGSLRDPDPSPRLAPGQELVGARIAATGSVGILPTRSRRQDASAPSISPIPPVLVAAAPANARQTMPPQHANYVIRATNWEAMTRGSASSIILAFLGRSIGVGSNQSARAPLALGLLISLRLRVLALRRMLPRETVPHGQGARRQLPGNRMPMNAGVAPSGRGNTCVANSWGVAPG